MDSINEIQRSWYHGNGLCDGCPRRDEDKVLVPHYGQGDVPADVAIVAQAPGGGAISDVEGEGIGDGKRTWKNYSDAEHTDASKASPGDFEVTPIEEVGNYESDIKIFVEALHDAFNDHLNRDADIYLTQHTKCQDIRTEDFNAKSDEGIDRCSQYLVPELETIDPDVVIMTGGKPDNHIQRALTDVGVQQDLPEKVGDVVFELEGEPRVQTYESSKIDATVLASYHWGWRAMGSMRRYCGIDNSAYTRLLSQEAVKHVCE